ncbi:PREDICTED: uncharacterized protein LOC105571212 [Vollenhovia emeryi]|uniref:uncharacterized protein LOC105571212 n=1 Tax=Vollenhovia emeryi TaxID=411798 RepID=UPI0005F3D486|nr:PREDICTED: uncharacterized protein LOC105571212 [Vollenhovia emeryi]
MDDLLTGDDDFDALKSLKATLATVFKDYGFELRKWASNEGKILEESVEDSEPKHFQDLKDPKTLGLLWDPEHDILRFSLRIKYSQKVTKRTILSAVAQIFDPLGLVGPVTVRAKMLLQKLWQLKLTWDETVPQEIYTAWTQYQTQLRNLEDIVIPRQARRGDADTIQLHGFSDASERAFGACIYVRATDEQGNHTVRLLAAKSRVAPLHTVTLPRLELNGAVLLARLSEKIRNALNIDKTRFYWWSDSEIVLHWIAGNPSRWNTFVANRVGEIQELTTNRWQHVSTHHNPADIISRGMEASELVQSDLWWKGPSWLSEDEQRWPIQPVQLPEVIPEIRQGKYQSLMIQAKPDLSYLLTRSSLLSKLTRVISYCIRFIKNTRVQRNQRLVGALNANELDEGTRALVRYLNSRTLHARLGI